MKISTFLARIEENQLFTFVYRFPAIAGTYKIEPFDSFDTGGWITAADINDQYSHIALLSNDYLWIFYDFQEGQPFSGKSHFVKLPFSQKESVLFKDDLLLIADEKNFIDGYIYRTRLNKVLKTKEEKAVYDFLFSRPCIRWFATHYM